MLAGIWASHYWLASTPCFNEIRSKLYKAEEVEAERLKLIAGIKWREQGERSNKFFLNMITWVDNKTFSQSTNS